MPPAQADRAYPSLKAFSSFPRVPQQKGRAKRKARGSQLKFLPVVFFKLLNWRHKSCPHCLARTWKQLQMTAVDMQAAFPSTGWVSRWGGGRMPSQSWLVATSGREGACTHPRLSCTLPLPEAAGHAAAATSTHQTPRLLLSRREVQQPRKAAAKSQLERFERQERAGER